MDQEHFDDLTRSVAGGMGTRRQALRALAGALLSGAYGGVAARLGLTEFAEAEAKQRNAKAKKKWRSQAELREQGQLQVEAKRNRKPDKDKKRDKKRQDETCCADGPCAAQGPCCPGQKPCGGGCVAESVCCWYSERTCPDGKCVPAGKCCLDERQCAGEKCVAWDTCCPEEKPCGDGCILKEECCVDDTPPPCPEPGDVVLCCHGEEVCRYHLDAPGCPYRPERAYDAVTCRCLCPNNTNDSLGLCCPIGYHGSIGLDGYCCHGDTFDTCVCALGFSKVNGQCRRT